MYIFPRITVGFLFSSIASRRPRRPRPRRPPRLSHVTLLVSHNTSHTTSHITSHLTHHFSHTTHLPQHISNHSSHPQLISSTTHLPQLISHHSSHPQLISCTHNSSHTSHLIHNSSPSSHTHLISCTSSHTHLTQHISHYFTHHISSHTILISHITSHTQLISHHSSHPQLISHNSSHTTHLIHKSSGLAFAWQAQYAELPEGAAARIVAGVAAAGSCVAGAVHRASWRSCGADTRRRGRGRRSTQSLLKELRRGYSPPWPRQTQYTEPPEGAAARKVAAMAAAGSCAAGAVHRAFWRICGADSRRRGRG